MTGTPRPPPVLNPLPKTVTLPMVACLACGAQAVFSPGWPLSRTRCAAELPWRGAPDAVPCGGVGFRLASDWPHPGAAGGTVRIRLLRLRERLR